MLSNKVHALGYVTTLYTRQQSGMLMLNRKHHLTSYDVTILLRIYHYVTACDHLCKYQRCILFIQCTSTKKLSRLLSSAM